MNTAAEKGLARGQYSQAPHWQLQPRPSPSEETSPSPPSPSISRFPYISRRRFWLTLALLVAGTSVIILLLSGPILRRSAAAEVVAPKDSYSTSVGPPPPDALQQGTAPEHLQAANYLAGPLTAHFQDSLRNDTQYLTSWLSAGWTNDVITLGNLIYLAKITSRIPILPPFTSHIGGASIPFAFSNIFDMPRLVRTLGIPILEWHQVKNISLAESLKEVDELGCWSIWEVDYMQADGPRGSFTPLVLNVDVSYTRAPSWVKLIPGFEHDMSSSFWSLARLAFPEARDAALADPLAHPTHPSERHGMVMPPNDQLLCYDYVYYACADQPFDFEMDYSPAWRDVMRHFRWTPTLEALGQSYLRRTLNVPDGAEIPPHITLHARHGDFANWCGGVPRDACFAPLAAFARRVREVQDELRARRGVDAVHVVMTGDEQDEAWWAEVRARGWLRVDHARERTVERLGNWYPVIIDAVIQSAGLGFVGTDRSTFSTLARRRVADWNDGAVRTVKWGSADADAH